MDRDRSPRRAASQFATALAVALALPLGVAACLSPAGTTQPEADERFLNLDPAVAYVGDASCASCHGELYTSYQTHGMAGSFSPMTPDDAVETFGSVSITDPATGFSYRPVRDGDAFYQEETLRDASGRVVHVLRRSMDHIVGSGTAARTYLTEENGRLYQLPLTWYTQADDEEGRLGGGDPWCDVRGPACDQTGHGRMNADGIRVVEGLAVDVGDAALQLELARDDILGEVALRDEVRDDVNFLRLDHVEGLTHGGLFLPEAAVDLGEGAALP